jgi:lambda family phage portal protein
MNNALIQRAKLVLRGALDGWSLGPGGSSTSLIAWDASKAGSRLGRWAPPSTDFASNLQPALLKRRARDSYRNNPWARRAVDILTAYCISTGVVPQVDLLDAGLRRRVPELWRAWTDQSDFDGRADLYGQQAATFRAALIDGESVTLIRPGKPLQLQVLPSEYLDGSRDNARDIAGGIQFDAEGKRTGYWLYSKNPASPLIPISTFVPEDRVIHLFAPLQPGYQRGVSWLAPALLPLYELQEYVETSLVRAKTGALFAGYIRSADGSAILQSDSGEPQFEPGSMTRLRPGDEISFSSPPDPTQGYDPFVKSQLRAIASALGLSYELLSGDYSQVTYASGRAGQMAFQRTCDSIVHNVFVHQWCRPVWNWWTRVMVATGELPEEILTAPVRWIPQPVPALDRRMEIESLKNQIRCGLISRSEAVSQTGMDPEALDEEIARDNARADKLQLIFDSDPRRTTMQGMPPVVAGGGTDASGNAVN